MRRRGKGCVVKSAKPWIFAGIVIALVVANYFFDWSGWVARGELQSMLVAMLDENFPLACAMYFVLSAVGCVVLALPGILFAVVAGVIFGPWLGTLLCWLSMSIGAWASFLVGRYFLKDALKPKLAKNKALNNLLFEGAHKSDVYLLAVTRLVPVFPFNLQNFAYGITDIKFIPYAVYSALFILPGTAVYTIGAAGIVDAENRVLCLVIAVVLFGITFLVAYLLKKKADIS